MTTHGAITYSNKAKAHKDLHNGLRYGVMIGNSKEKGVPPRLLNHGDNFDFMIVFENDIPTKEEWKVFIDVIKRNLNHSNNLESIINSRHNRNKKRYFCIERDIIYYDKVE